VDPFDQGFAGAFFQRPAQQGLEAATEKCRHQRTFNIALYINHRRGTGDQVVQPRMGSRDLLLLVLDITDIQHITDDTPPGATAQHLALNPVPPGWFRAPGLMQPGEQQ